MSNERTLEMVATLRARLADLEQAVRDCPVELVGMAERIDALDDQAYLMQLEAEKAAQPPTVPEVVEAETVSEDGSTRKVVRLEAVTDDQWGDPRPVKRESSVSFADTKLGPVTITADMKAGMRDGAHAAAEVMRDGREIVGELTDTMGDLKDLFGFRPRRR